VDHAAGQPRVGRAGCPLFLVDKRPSQAQYIILDFLAHADPLIERFERWARANLAEGFSLQGAAHALSVTPRTLQRRTEAVLGRSPLSFFQDMRVEHARHLISIGSNLEEVADEVGYADAATLRSLLRKRLGRGVRELRTAAQLRKTAAEADRQLRSGECQRLYPMISVRVRLSKPAAGVGRRR
jgi:transcriptional regulator GlxA family with amidase domain